MPKELSKEKIIMVLVKIKYQEIELVVDKKLKMQSKINNICGSIYGKCTEVLHSVIRGK